MGALPELLGSIARDAGATVITPADFLCIADVCPLLSADGRPRYMDQTHLAASFVMRSVLYLDGLMRGD
jgi:hypothetical protein